MILQWRFANGRSVTNLNKCSKLLLLLSIVLSALLPTLARAVDSQHDSGALLYIKDLAIPYRAFAAYVLPGQPLQLKLPPGRQVSTSRWITASGKLEMDSGGQWVWRHNTVGGPYRLMLELDGRQAAQLNVFVLQSADRIEKGRLDGYNIGYYPTKPLRGLASYRNPEGFVRVTQENLDTLVSPNFRLSEFVSKQQSDFPKYLVLNEQLLIKLERILSHIQGKGVTCDSFHVMSGYRTPFYNKAIGNVRYSRHQWGDAADIFVDCDPKDNIMDDLNRDGKTDFRDAAHLAQWIDEITELPPLKYLSGGLAPYPATSAHGPFVHVDTRGYRARWSGNHLAHQHP